MKSFRINDIEIKAIASAVPDNIVNNSDYIDIYSKTELERVCRMCGVYERRTAPEGMSSLDLMYQAVKKLFLLSEVEINDIDCMICVTQTPCYNIPGNSYVLCNMLGADNDIVTLDINAGCPGFTHGLITMAKMLDTSDMKTGLLVLGDTFTKLISDRKDELVYGDGAAACLVSYKGAGKELYAQWKTVSEKYEKILSFGDYAEKNTDVFKKAFNHQTNRALYMDGQELFCFGMKEIPEIIMDSLSANGLNIDDIDLFLFHQSNKTLLEHVGMKLSIPKNKIPIYMNEIGCAGSASIPIALCRYAQENKMDHLSGRLCFTGFGAGLSISTLILDVDHLLLYKSQK